MPATQRGQAYRLGANRWGLRCYDAAGARRRKAPFPSKSAALAYYRSVIEPELRGDPTPMPELTLSELVDLYLERHAATVRPTDDLDAARATCATPSRAFGDVPLRDLERMSGEIAAWRARLPERSRYGLMGALRQTLDAGVRWGYMAANPAKLAGRNRSRPRGRCAPTASEIDAIAAELAPGYRPLPVFAAATGLRPEEWAALERRDIDRQRRVLTVHRTVSGGEVVELAKTAR